ncbi:unnamed protein product [Rhizophagus irregularis]|nr:unnamed protein product [Rhizophagus irregularis]
MDYFQTQAYIGVIVGITVMINLHNMIVSIFLACLAVPQLGLQRPDLQSISENNLIGKPNQENNKRNQKNPTKSKTKSLLTIDTSDSPSQFLSKLTPHTPRSMKQHEKRLSISEWTNTAIDNFNDEIIEEPRSQNNWDFNNEKIIEEPLSLNNNNHSVTIQLNNTTNND